MSKPLATAVVHVCNYEEILKQYTDESEILKLVPFIEDRGKALDAILGLEYEGSLMIAGEMHRSIRNSVTYACMRIGKRYMFDKRLLKLPGATLKRWVVVVVRIV